jgi:diguanylate cyclase
VPVESSAIAVESALKQLYESVFVVLLATAGGFHIIYVGIFLAFELHALVVASLFAMAAYSIVWWCLKRGWSYLALAGAGLTALLHSAYASSVLGWDSDFYLFVFPALLFLLLSPYFSRVLKFAIFAITAMAYIAAEDFIAPRITPELDLLVANLEIFNNLGLCFFLGLIAWLYGVAIKRATGELTEMNLALTRLATVDDLSGLYNRRYLTEQLEQELVRFQRTGHVFSVIVADVDNFKSINDTYGHQSGDRVITEIGRALRASVRAQDRVARWGGEEFLVFLPATTIVEAEVMARRVQLQLQCCTVTGLPLDYKIRMTFGLAEFTRGQSLDALLAAADHALYRGKAAGKDRIVAASPHNTT